MILVSREWLTSTFLPLAWERGWAKIRTDSLLTPRTRDNEFFVLLLGVRII